jgi:carbonic anhydrase/acetyltransferase-like protein (isoleucine patch superfamily)
MDSAAKRGVRGSSPWPARIGALGTAAPRIHPRAWVAPGAVVVGDVTLGRGTSVWYGAVLRADDAQIVVGAACNIQDLCCLHADPGEPVVLEDNVSLGHGAVVHGAHVQAGALVGIGAIVLGRARIGAGSLIAAGAVVAPGSTVPAGVLVAGVPGRVLRELTEADREVFAGTASAYVARADRHRAAVWG